MDKLNNEQIEKMLSMTENQIKLTAELLRSYTKHQTDLEVLKEELTNKLKK